MDLLKEIGNLRTIVISGHTRPDGDCVGSVMATYLYLKKKLPDAVIVPMIEKPAAEFECIDGIQDICSDFIASLEQFDVFIGLDCSTEDRYGEALKYYLSSKKKIVIDHHISNEGFGDASLIDGSASSTCELIFDLISKEDMDERIALALYIGIIHDTGVLQYSCTSPKTLRTVASLIEFGFDFPKIIDETFYERTKLQNDILGKCLEDAKEYLDGKVMASKVTKELMDKMQVVPHDFDGIVNQLRYVKGVEVSVFMYEIEEGSFKVSMRSRGLVDVAKIAKKFEGGGHMRAAGLTLKGNYEEIMKTLTEEIALQL